MLDKFKIQIILNRLLKYFYESYIKFKYFAGVNRYGHNRSNQGTSNNSLQIPKNWMNCPSIATLSVADSFVTFKTPLDYKYDSKIAIMKRFNPQMVFSHMYSYQVLDNIEL